MACGHAQRKCNSILRPLKCNFYRCFSAKDKECRKRGEKINGTQLYGLSKLKVKLQMMQNEVLKSLPIKQKLGLNYVAKESKLTRLGERIFSNTFTPYFPSKAYDRYLAGAVKISTGTPAPVISNFAVTAKCYCSCWHCSFSDRDKEDGMSTEQMKKSMRSPAFRSN